MQRTSSHTVDDDALEHLERLARLVIEPAERENLKADLVELLGFVDSLLEADVEGVEEYGPGQAGTSGTGAGDGPTLAAAGTRDEHGRIEHARNERGVSERTGTERADVVTQSLPSSAALAMAPEDQDGFYKVPRTVEEG
ncbi:MAG TPA: Asp-tRNA(Asn)/Glu-tRNA(Gln) amidotransferase subunit GatC [Trueperaceae bacterium]|nr:Asp-tRNA(Asn)/Glu-tRNA(Gln) amidotransferase subunit GatC [Trueperaceae bacterium]